MRYCLLADTPAVEPLPCFARGRGLLRTLRNSLRYAGGGFPVLIVSYARRLFPTTWSKCIKGGRTPFHLLQSETESLTPHTSPLRHRPRPFPDQQRAAVLQLWEVLEVRPRDHKGLRGTEEKGKKKNKKKEKKKEKNIGTLLCCVA